MKLSLKLPLLVLFLVLFFAIGYQSIFYFQIQQNIVDARVSEATSIIQLSSDEIRDSVYFSDYETLNLQLNNLKKNPLITNVLVMHSDGKIISDGTKSNVNFGQIPTDNFIQSSIDTDMMYVEINENMIQLSTPIKIIDKIGILQLDYSLKDVNQILNESIYVLLIFSGVLSIMGMGFGFFISSSITKPIQNIKKISWYIFGWR